MKESMVSPGDWRSRNSESGQSQPEGQHRRDFLTGRAALRWLADWWDRASRVEVSRRFGVETPSYLVEYSRKAMGCQFQVLLNAGQYLGSEEAASHALDLIEQLEREWSVFDESSELMRVNRFGYPGPVEVGPRLHELLRYSRSLTEATGGAFDISASPLWRLWGFARREGRIPSSDELAHALGCVGNGWWDCDDSQRTVRFLKAGVELNLGSIGKGYALDLAACRLMEAGIRDFVLNGGDSSVLACGDRSGGDGWLVGLAHPLVANRRLGLLRLRNRALGTSSAARQFFYHVGRRFGHVLDPRTGWPVQHWESVTVVAACAAAADALATAFFVMQPEAIYQFCSSQSELGVVLVRSGPKAGELEIETLGLAPDEFLPDVGDVNA